MATSSTNLQGANIARARLDQALASPSMRLNVLLLSGGQSTRMGSPKHLLPFLDNQPIFCHLLKELHVACPAAELYLSLKNSDQSLNLPQPSGMEYKIVFDDASSDDALSGPAAGLLAAHEADTSAHWMVLACDYPLMTAAELLVLLQVYEEPVTCFRNAEGWHEPLVAMWSPTGLELLKTNVHNGYTGPIKTVRMLNGKTIKPAREMSLFNANTPEEWNTALELARNTIQQSV